MTSAPAAREPDIEPVAGTHGPVQPRLTNRRLLELAERWKPEGIAPVGGAELVSLIQEVQMHRRSQFNNRSDWSPPRPKELF